MSSVDTILQALDAFIRRYYKSLVIRGLLLAVGIVVGLYLALVLTEHVGWFAPQVRALLFWGGVAAAVVVLAWLVVRPLLKMCGLSRRRLSRAEAAQIVGKHFPEVSDKLLNLLQLIDSPEQSDLLLAAIEQKASRLRPVPLLHAVDLRANRRYLWYALPPLLLVAVLLLLSPRTVSGPTHRIVNYNTAFERPAPFHFRLLSDTLRAMQGDDFVLRVATEGEAEPAEVQIFVDDYPHAMASDAGVFSYTFRQLSRSHRFRLEGGGVVSADYVLEMLPVPSVVEFSMHLAYPAYTGREPQTLVDLGDAFIPEGTTVRWNFQTRDADSLHLLFDSVRHQSLAVDANGRVGLARTLLRSTSYAFFTSVRFGGEGEAEAFSDTLRYLLSVVPDVAPLIEVEEAIDSVRPDRRLFHGVIKDDYGFSRLVFRHELGSATDTAQKAVSEAEIALGEGASQEFYFSFNTAELMLHPGDVLTYYFEVSDNDAIHGPKSTRSRSFEIAIPTERQLDSLMARNASDAQQKASLSMSQLQELQEDINEMMRKLVDKKELTWQDRKELERIAEKQREVRQMMQQMQQQVQENNRLQQKYQEHSEQLMEKQRELDRLMNEVMDEQMKQTMAEIDRLMQELDKKKVQQELEQLKVDNAELEKQIDQNLELMKRLELEKRVEQTVQKMEQLAEQQRDVSRETEQAKGKNNEELLSKQEQLNEQFQQLSEEVKNLQRDYHELDPQSKFNIPDSLQKQVQEHQQQAKQDMQRGKNRNASENQREAADAMQKLADAIEQAELEAEQDDLAEDAEQVRQLLKNLVGLSKNQEALIADVQSTYIQDPRYQTIIASQHRVSDDFRSIDDSLRAMAKRQVQVASAITKEVAKVNSNVAASLSSLLNMNQSFYAGNRNTSASRSMQYAMTSLNNLALVLAESLDQMQNQMRQNAQKQRSKNNSKMKSNQQCSNPGSKPSPKSMRQMQQELNKQMEALKKQLDKQGKPNQRHQVGQQNGMSEQLTKMAAQQEMIRRMMQEYGQELKQQDAGNSKMAKEIEQMIRQMEQTETDLVNRTITRQTIQRQQQIMSRMLEHEKADMEREKEERRESHEGADLYSQPSPAELDRFNRQQRPSLDQLRTLPPTLSPYYRAKVDNYFAQ